MRCDPSAEPSMRDEVAAVRWYHSIELPGGIVTPGLYDLTSSVAHSFFPSSLRGRRCLDVGTHDGFWAFEMERRGASEVIAIDLDDPSRLDWPGAAPSVSAELLDDHAARRQAFELAHTTLGSSVQRRNYSVYDLNVA